MRMVVPLPATMVEAEAKACATKRIEDLLQTNFEGFGPLLEPATGRHWLRAALKRKALSHPLQMMEVIDYARGGWVDAENALRELAIEIVDRGETLPTALGAFTMEALRGFSRIPGRHRANYFLQDIFIAFIAAELVEKFGLKPTRRNSTSNRPSACSVTASAVTEAGIDRPMGEKAVEVLWKRYGVWLLPDSLRAF